MVAPVWVLSVDLQTKTATFQTGMAEAARSTRSAFKGINDGASEMGESVGRGGLDVRHALGLVDNTIRGAHTMAMADLIRMFKDSALVMGALPFAMTVAGFALVAEMVVKGVQAFEAYRQAQEKLKDEQTEFGTTVQDVFNGLTDKILDAEKQTDELSNNHLGALHKELELIDHQSLSELEHSFETISKAADQLFGDLKAGWYQMGIGSEGAMHALDTFRTQYNSLLAQGKGGEAAGLLSGTLDQAKRILELQQQLKGGSSFTPTGNTFQNNFKYNQLESEKVELKKAGVGWTEKEIESQQALVGALSAQVEVEQKITTLKSAQDINARLQTAKEMTKSDNGLDSKVSAGRARMMQDLYGEYEQKVAIVQQGERETIDATKQGTAERLQAIEDGMAREEADGLQGTSFYKQLAIQKLEVQREIGQQQAAQAAAISREQADSDEKMGELQLAADKQRQALVNSARRVSAEQAAAQAAQFANDEYRIKMAALMREIEGLDQSGQEYLQKVQQLQDKEKQLTQQHENDIANIKEKQTIAMNQRVLASLEQFNNSVASGLAQSIMRHESWARMLDQLGNQVVSGLIQNAIKEAEAAIIGKEAQAAKAARTAYLIGENVGGPGSPIGMVLGPTFAALAFATVSGYASGGIVPGVERGDVVSAMLTPGEAVLPKGLTEMLTTAARNGDSGGGSTNHFHYRPTFHVQTIDSSGVQEMLSRHSDEFSRHFHGEMRKMNR